MAKWSHMASWSTRVQVMNCCLTEPLTDHQICTVAFTWEQFHKKCSRIYNAQHVFGYIHSELLSHLPGTNKLMAAILQSPHCVAYCNGLARGRKLTGKLIFEAVRHQIFSKTFISYDLNATFGPRDRLQNPKSVNGVKRSKSGCIFSSFIPA